MTDRTFKLDRLAMHQEWYDKNRTLLFIEASVVMQELLAMCRQYKAERDEARRLVCELATEYKAEMFCPKGTIIPKSDRALANAYGWNCFKENP